MRFRKNPFAADYCKIGIGVILAGVVLVFIIAGDQLSLMSIIIYCLLNFGLIALMLYLILVTESIILIDREGVHEYWWHSNILHAEILWTDCAYIEVSAHYYGLQREICFSRFPLPPDGKIKKRAKDVIDMNATDEAVLNAVYAYVSPDRINFVTRANVR